MKGYQVIALCTTQWSKYAFLTLCEVILGSKGQVHLRAKHMEKSSVIFRTVFNNRSIFFSMYCYTNGKFYYKCTCNAMSLEIFHVFTMMLFKMQYFAIHSILNETITESKIYIKCTINMGRKLDMSRLARYEVLSYHQIRITSKRYF